MYHYECSLQDEAHNLLETISSIHSICIWGGQLSQAQWQLSQYQKRFNDRLSSKNLLFIKQLLFFLSCLMKSLGLSSKATKEKQSFEANEEKVYDCCTFCIEAGFDHLNINSLIEFCENSKLPQKLTNFKPVNSEVTPIGGLKSFLEKVKSDGNNKPISPEEMITEEKETGSPLMAILDFMRCLRNPSQDGRVLCVKKLRSSVGYLKYILLNPGSLFQDFVKEPR